MEHMAMALSVTSAMNNYLTFTSRPSAPPFSPLKSASSSLHHFNEFHFRPLSCPPLPSKPTSFVIQCCKGNDEYDSSSERFENLGPSQSGHSDTQGSVNHSSSPSSPFRASRIESNIKHGGETDDLRRENIDLRSAISALSDSLASISAALNEVSQAVQLVANAIDSGSSGSIDSSDEAQEPAVALSTAVVITEPWDRSELKSGQVRENMEGSSAREGGVSESADTVPTYLIEQNSKAHALAYRLQQAFVQARIEGLGKPFELAVDDFVLNCMEAHSEGLGLKELQLQLILLEGALTGAFAIRNQRYSDDTVMNEESRVRSSWVRLVYATIAAVQERRAWIDNPAGIESEIKQQPDPSDIFVKEVIKRAFEEGYDLSRLKLEQSVAGPATSAAVKAMRQSTYLILLTLQRATTDSLNP